MSNKPKINCTFCGKDSTDKTCLCLIAAPNKAYICDKCVEVARDIVGVYRSGTNKIVYKGNVASNLADNSEEVERLQEHVEAIQKVSNECGIIGMVGSIAWKAQMLRLNKINKNEESDNSEQEG